MTGILLSAFMLYWAGVRLNCLFFSAFEFAQAELINASLPAFLRALGILKKGQLVETDRSGLVAEYVGQTAVKTDCGKRQCDVKLQRLDAVVTVHLAVVGAVAVAIVGKGTGVQGGKAHVANH